MAIHLTAQAAYGYGGKQYIARVTGRDPKWGMRLEFVGARGGKRDETTSYAVDSPGLYKVRDWTRKNREEVNYVLVIEKEDGELESYECEDADASKISKGLHDGRTLESMVVGTDDGYEMVTPRQAERAAAAKNIDDAITQCWLILQALPVEQAKKAVAELRKRATPTKPLPAPLAEAPVGIVADIQREEGAPDDQTGFGETPIAAE
jgi:hypothetical protein